MLSLAHLTFVNTRPAQQADTLNHLLNTFGAEIINFPTLEIETINALETKSICQNKDIAIFVSANAAHCSHDDWPSPFPISTVIAAGPGTGKILEKYGISNIILPEQYNSEGILALQKLAFVQNKKIIIFCGKNSRPLLHETLRQQGATVTLCECYRRVCPKRNKETLALLQNKKIDGIISTSQESLKNLNLLLKDHTSIKENPLIVISASMEIQAKAQGWKNVIVAPNASNDAIVETLAKLDNIT